MADPETVRPMTDAERIAELETQLHETEDKLNEQMIRNAEILKDSTKMAGQLAWMTRKYNELDAFAFDALFDLSVEIKQRHLRYIIMERGQEELALEKAEQNKENP